MVVRRSTTSLAQGCIKSDADGGGGGVWDPKFCVPKMAHSDFPDCKFRFFPRWSLWSGRVQGGYEATDSGLTYTPVSQAHGHRHNSLSALFCLAAPHRSGPGGGGPPTVVSRSNTSLPGLRGTSRLGTGIRPPHPNPLSEGVAAPSNPLPPPPRPVAACSPTPPVSPPAPPRAMRRGACPGGTMRRWPPPPSGASAVRRRRSGPAPSAQWDPFAAGRIPRASPGGAPRRGRRGITAGHTTSKQGFA